MAIETGEKYTMIQEIRQKTKRIRELEEKIDIYKQREQQIRETCEAWKKEVDVVREQLEEQLHRTKTDHEAVVTTLKLSYEAELKQLQIENKDLNMRVKASNENNELLRRQLLERTVPEVNQYRPTFNPQGQQYNNHNNYSNQGTMAKFFSVKFLG